MEICGVRSLEGERWAPQNLERKEDGGGQDGWVNARACISNVRVDTLIDCWNTFP